MQQEPRAHCVCHSHLIRGRNQKWEVLAREMLQEAAMPTLRRCRLQKRLRETLRSYYCFTPHEALGSEARTVNSRSRPMSYSCDPTIDPKLKRPAASRSAGSLTPMSPFSTPGPSTSSIRGRSVSTHLEHGFGSPSTSAWMSSALQNALQMGEPDDQGGENGAFDDIDPSTSLQSGQGTAQTALPFILDTDQVYERREPRYNNEVYYCFQCGPLTLLRRRRDGCFAIRPVRLVNSFHK